MSNLKLLLHGDCQTLQLQALFTVVLGNRCTVHQINASANAEIFSKLDDKYDIILSNMKSLSIEERFPHSDIIHIPSIYFGGFHPDVVYMRRADKQTEPVFYIGNASCSGLIIKGYYAGLSQQKTRGLYSDEAYDLMCFNDFYGISASALMSSLQKYSLSIDPFERHLSGKNIFMHGPMHPKLSIIASLVESILKLTDISADASPHNCAKVMKDPKEHEYSWSCFPPMARNLGIEGDWIIRHYDTHFTKIETYISHVYNFLNSLDYEVALLDQDNKRFNELHKVDGYIERIKNASL